jgi:hypothetical protein
MRFGIWLLGFGICLSACGPSAPLLANTYSSAHAAAAAVLDSLARRDMTTLRALALTEQEFRDHVWPELPASRPERNLPFSYVWGDLHQKSEAALARTLARHGGRRYTLVSVEFGGGASRYPSYTVHRETVLEVRDGSGMPAQVRLFGSLIEQERAWKVFSYVVDD